MGTVISTANMKGGVGKTTLTVNLATCLAKDHGKRVLVVDLDSQISATLSLLAPQEFAKLRRNRRTLSYLIDKVVTPNIPRKYSTPDLVCSQICEISGLELLPGDIELYDEYAIAKKLHDEAVTSGSEEDFARAWEHFERDLVQQILAPVLDDYDFILLDCAPGYNLLTRSGISASDFYLLPARPEPLSLVGIQLLEQRIKKLKRNRSDRDKVQQLQLIGIAFILTGGGFFGKYYKQVMQRIEKDFTTEQLFKNRIPLDVNIAKAVDSFTPAVVATPLSPGSRAFINLAEEFLGKMAAAQAKTLESKVKS